MDSKEFLYNYLNAFSPVGQETEGQKIWADYIRPFADQVKVDAYGTAYGILKGNTADQDLSHRYAEPYRVVLEAHCDEIAWIITQIEKDGYVRVKRAGGSDNMIAASKSVIVHTHKGQKVKAFFGSPAVHVRDKYTEMGPDQHELWLDFGVDSADKVKELGVEDPKGRAKEMGYDPKLEKKKLPGSFTRKRLEEVQKEKMIKVLEDMVTKKSKDTDIQNKEINASKLLIKNLKTLKKMAEKEGLSNSDILKLLKNE